MGLTDTSDMEAEEVNQVIGWPRASIANRIVSSRIQGVCLPQGEGERERTIEHIYSW